MKMNFFIEDKDMLNSVLSQLKVMGVKVPKLKKIKINNPKQDKGSLQSNKVFGVCLADQGASNSNPPKFILSCTEYLLKYSKEIGLFRKAGSVVRQKNLRVKIENGGSFDGSEPNDVASLLKQWLRELPEPLIPCYLHDALMRCQNLNNNGSIITATLLICLLLPPDHLHTLKHLMCFLAEIVTDEDKNQMSVKNLGLIIAPNVVGNNPIDNSSNIKIQKFTSIIQLLILNANKIGEMPPYISLTTLDGKIESELSSLSEVFESSPCISRKQYLLRSFKKLVKPNTTSVTSPAIVTPDCSSTLLRQTLSVNNIERVCLKATAETKGNSNLFAPRNTDVCKRSFRLLMRKDKRGLKPPKECHPFTQSLEIESPLHFQMEVDKIKMYPSIQVPLTEEKSDIDNFWTINHFDDKHSGLEDIEMTTFSTHRNEQSNNLVAFPIPSFSQYLQPKPFISKLKNEYNDKTETQKLHFSPSYIINGRRKADECKNLQQGVEVKNLTEIRNDTSVHGSGYSMGNRDLQQPKVLAQNSCKLDDLKLEVGEDQNSSSNTKENSYKGMKEIKNNSGVQGSMVINKNSLLTNAEVASKISGNSDVFRQLRGGTFIIEPSQNIMSVDKIQRPCIDDVKCKKSVKNATDTKSHDNLSQKRHCTALNTRSKNLPAKRASTKSISSVKANVAKSKSSIKQAALQKTKHSTHVKRRNNVLNLDKKMENSKMLVNRTISSRSEFETAGLQTRESHIRKMHNTLPSCLPTDECSRNTDSSSKNSLETSLMSKRKLSFSRYPAKASSRSDSKIPRLSHSLEVSKEATNHPRKVSKSKTTVKSSASDDNATETPFKGEDNRINLSTLELSINDSCFLTPKRNALLSPNSVVWMSGNKYFSSSSPVEIEAFNKRESIAMILKTNSGHVQAKVHLYDDLIRESVDSSPNVPNPSTPTSKFSTRLSSSQSLKSTPRRTSGQKIKSGSCKNNSANRSNSVKSEKSLESYLPKFTTHLSTPSPIKSHSLKDVTNTSVVFNGSKSSHGNFQIRDENVSIFLDGNNHCRNKRNRKPKGKSFSGKTSQRFVKKISRSESSPGCPRPHLRVSTLIRESNCE